MLWELSDEAISGEEEVKLLSGQRYSNRANSALSKLVNYVSFIIFTFKYENPTDMHRDGTKNNNNLCNEQLPSLMKLNSKTNPIEAFEKEIHVWSLWVGRTKRLTSSMRVEAFLAAWKNGESQVYLKLHLFFSEDALYTLCYQRKRKEHECNVTIQDRSESLGY